MDRSLLHHNIAFFYNNLSEFSHDVDRYFHVHKSIYNWLQIGNLFRQQLRMNISYEGCNKDFGSLKYEQFRELAQALQHIFVKSLSMQQNILNDLQNFNWLGSNVQAMQLLIETNFGETSNVEHILLLTAMMEYALGNVYYTRSKGKNPPHLLRDLLSTDELLEVFGWEAIWFLKILLGSPHAINLRNIAWHGFPRPDDMPQYYVSALIVAINTLGMTLCELNMHLMQRTQIVEVTRYLEKIQVGLPYTKDLLTTLNNALSHCTWLSAAHKTFWFQILSYFEKKNWWQLVLLVLPQIELLLRLLYAQANDYDVTAKLDEYYITIDTMFETHVPSVDNRLNNLQLPGTHFINLNVLKFMYDLFVAPHGPRIRDKVSHGEVTLECLNDAQLCHMLLQLSVELLMPTNNSFVYESVFHLNGLTWQGIKNAKIHLLQLIQLPLLAQNVQTIANEATKYLRNTSINNLKIFQRPKSEAGLMQLLLKIAHLLTQTCLNYSESVTERCLLLRQRELHSKRRRTFEKMLSTLPEICKTLCKVMCCIEDIFCNMQLVEDAKTNLLEDVEKTRRFLKKNLQIVENFSKYAAKDSNEWIKALELCKTFDESRERYIDAI